MSTIIIKSAHVHTANQIQTQVSPFVFSDQDKHVWGNQKTNIKFDVRNVKTRHPFSCKTFSNSFIPEQKYLNNRVPRLSVFYQPKDGDYSSFPNLVPRVLQALKCGHGAWGAVLKCSWLDMYNCGPACQQAHYREHKHECTNHLLKAQGHHNMKEGAVISRLQAVMASQLSSWWYWSRSWPGFMGARRRRASARRRRAPTGSDQSNEDCSNRRLPYRLNHESHMKKNAWGVT